MRSESRNSISKNIKKYRLLNNMTQEELAGKLYLDTQYYAQLERGERNFTIEKIIQICNLFHIGVENIIEISPQQNALETTELCQEISSQLNSLSQTQLTLLKRFISEILPFIK